MAEVSPLPYSIRTDKGPVGRSVALMDLNGGVVALLKAANGRKVQNAAFLAKAANCHDELLGELRSARLTLSCLGDVGDVVLNITVNQTIAKIDAAIARAEGR